MRPGGGACLWQRPAGAGRVEHRRGRALQAMGDDLVSRAVALQDLVFADKPVIAALEGIARRVAQAVALLVHVASGRARDGVHVRGGVACREGAHGAAVGAVGANRAPSLRAARAAILCAARAREAGARSKRNDVSAMSGL